MSDDWSGVYLGGHFGYAAGTSNWSATSTAAPALAGSLDLFNSVVDIFRGTGSYFLGFQAGYNYLLPSATSSLASRPTHRSRA